METPEEFLTCAEPVEWPAPVTRQVGSAGDSLHVGDSYFVIPPNAVPGNSTRTFTLAPVRSDRVGVEVTSQPPAQFANGLRATLAIGLTRCTPEQVGDTAQWAIWLMRGATAPGGRPLDTSRRQGRLVATRDSTSSYMIAN